jgi:hypothetical protein
MNHAVVTTAARDLAIVTTVQARISEPAWSNPGSATGRTPGWAIERCLYLSLGSAGAFQVLNLLMKPASTTARVEEDPGSVHCGL